jgi:hypothetical protein
MTDTQALVEKIAALPITEHEIQAEVDAVRAERRRSTGADRS